VYNLPILKQLVLLLHWILVTINDALASLGLGPNWTWGLAIIGMTIIVRLVLFPLTWKQFSSAQSMQVIQPKLKELQKKYKSDRGKLQQETMKLYQEHRVNPFASCLPLLLQLPVFISLYAAIKGLGPLSAPIYQPSVAALNHASFLWIPHLGFPDPYYILLVLYVVTQLISTELMLTTQTDKSQKMIMRAMPLMFVFFLFRFPAGLFVYWVTTNLWTIGQQLLIRKYMKPTDLETMSAKPAKRKGFMEAIMSAQGDRMQTREELIAKQKAQSAKQGGVKQPGVKQAAGQPGAKQAAGQPGAKKGARKAPPGKGRSKQSPPAGQGKSQIGPTDG
jgi:YidC/Oxa1 family membrane protein insertase